MERVKKNIFHALIFMPVFSMVQGCTIYSDKDDFRDASQEVAIMLYTNMVHPVFRIAELVDFYEAYQKIQEDTDASLALAEQYFGDNLVELNPDEVTVEYWGTIKKSGEDAVYYADSYMMWKTMSTIYQVTVTGPRVYYIECESVGKDTDLWKKFMTDAMVTVSDNILRVEELLIEYVDKDDVSAVVHSTDEIMQLPRSSSWTVGMPFSGVLGYEISGNVSDSFSVRFSDSGIIVMK